MTAGLVELEIASIAAGGDGVGRTEGMVVFVPRGAPGDVAQVRLARSKRFARGEIDSISIASPDRGTPQCVRYTRDHCGGCQIQHLSYEAQLRAKGSIIGDALRRIGRRTVEDVEVRPSDGQWRYRRKLTLHVRRAGARWVAGLHPYDDPAFVFDLSDCPITDERVMAVWRALRPAFDFLPRERAVRVAVRLLDPGAAVVIEGGGAWEDYDKFFETVPAITELWWKPEHGRMRRLATRAGETQAGSSFVQVNAQVAAQLEAHLLERAHAYAPRRVVDAYAGSGGTALPLASGGATVVAIELDAEAVARFADRLPPPSSVVIGRVEDHLAAALPADLVILNPPRGGIDERVARALQDVKSPPSALLYVSCDPATLARDLARMPRYRLVAVRAYDMFPQTAHVETVCELVPEAA